MEVLEHNNHFFIRLDKSKKNFSDQLAVVKALPHRKWNEQNQCWYIPKNGYRSLDQLVHQLNADLQRYAVRRMKNVEVQKLPELTIDIPLKKEMFPFQKQGVAYNIQHNQVLIGDQQGLGKTIQALATVLAKGKFPGLIICKSSLKLNWQKEIEEWTDLKPLVFSDSVKLTWPHLFQAGWFDVGIVNYESLQKYFVQRIDPLKPKEVFSLKHIHFWKWIEIFKFIIVDESHYVKDTKTKRTKFVAGLTKGKEQVYLLSGTPALNDPIELYTQLCILNKNHLFGKKSVYKEMFCGKNNKGNLKQLNYLLTQHCYYRRTKQEVLKDLPDKTRQVILCELSNRDEYNKAESDFRKFLESQLGLTGGQIDKKLRAEALTKMMELKKIAAHGKLHAVKEWLESLVEQDEKVVVFGYHKEVNQAMIKMIPHSVAILSQQDTPSDLIQANKHAFMNDPKTKVIVCSISAAAEGHTLTAASNLGMVELPWHFGKAEQCEDRIHRIGQQMPVTIAYFLADNTIDRRIYDLIMDKKDMHDKITGTEDDVQEKVIDKMINLFTSKQ